MNSIDFLTDYDLDLERTGTTCRNCTSAAIHASNIQRQMRAKNKKRVKLLEPVTSCVFCHGVGYYDCPTVFGRKILEFVRKYRKDILDEF